MRKTFKPMCWIALFVATAAGCGDNEGDDDDDDDDDDDVVLDARADSTVDDAARFGDAATPDGSAPGDAAADGSTTSDASTPDDAAADSATPEDAAIAADAAASDAASGPDAASPDGGVQPALGTHLLITEVKTIDADEFIEIYNPTDVAVALDHYYLADVNGYFLLPSGIGAGTSLDVSTTDFVARFPEGSSIPARGVITVASDGPGFSALHADTHATFAIEEAGAGDTAMVLLDGTGVTLTNGGEMVVLFYWDGASDLVKDVDLIIAGNAPSAGNTIAAKTAVDGPDLDDAASSYAADAATIGDLAADTESDLTLAQSYQRLALESATVESQLGTGNGMTGDDETSEQIRMTWSSAGHEAATPGTIPAALQGP